MEPKTTTISVKGVQVSAWKVFKATAKKNGRILGVFLSELLTKAAKDKQ